MSFRRNLLISLFIMVLPILGFSQENDFVCGTHHPAEAEINQNQRLQKVLDYVNQRAEAHKHTLKKKRNKKRIIPVVVHIIHNNGPANLPDEMVKNAINRLNIDFQTENLDTADVKPVFKDRIADFNYEFRLAGNDPNGNCTDGITRTESSLTNNQLILNRIQEYPNETRFPAWNPDEYLNIWVVRSIYDRDPNSEIAGQAHFPFPLHHSKADGIIIRADNMNGQDRTLTHEVGHYIGLYHPFYRGCYDGDEVEDTPPVADRDRIVSCNTETNCPNDDLPDMTHNYMDYTTCHSMFTKGQKKRAESFFLPDTVYNRAELVSRANLQKTGVLDTTKAPEITNIHTEGSYIYACQPVHFHYDFENTCRNGDLAAGTPTEINWSFTGGSPENSSANTPIVSFDSPGVYDVKLKISNSSGKDTVVKEKMVHVFDNDLSITSPFFESFESSELQKKGIVLQPNKEGLKWEYTTKTSAHGDGAIYLNNHEINDRQEVEFRLPKMDLARVRNPTLKFDLAFTRKSNEADDMLSVYSSDDCGKTWDRRGQYFNIHMKSSPETTDEYVPQTEDDWKTKNIYLTSKDDLLVKFVFTTSAAGNNAYIDNLRMNYNTGLADEKNLDKHIAVYPNPVKGKIYVKKEGKPVNAGLKVTDMTGRELYTKQNVTLGSGNERHFTAKSLNINENGVYFLNFLFDNRTVTKKIVLVQ